MFWLSNLTLEERQCKFCIHIVVPVAYIKILWLLTRKCTILWKTSSVILIAVTQSPQKRWRAKNRTLDLRHGKQARQQLSNFTLATLKNTCNIVPSLFPVLSSVVFFSHERIEPCTFLAATDAPRLINYFVYATLQKCANWNNISVLLSPSVMSLYHSCLQNCLLFCFLFLPREDL